MTRQSTEQEKIPADHMSDKDLVSRLHKKANNSATRETNLTNGQRNSTDISPKKLYKRPKARETMQTQVQVF